MADETKKFTVKLEGQTGQFTQSFTSAGKAAQWLQQQLGGAAKGSAQWAEASQRAAMQMSRMHSEALKLNSTLDKTRTMGGRLSEAFKSFTSGGGVSGALAALGPAGVAATAALGAVTFAAKTAIGAVADLASKAEGWSNVAEATGLGVVAVQQLADTFEDAGFSADATEKVMKSLSTQLANGGKDWAKYGLDIKGMALEGKTAEERLRAVAAAIVSIPDPMIRSAAATEIFGKGGARSIAALREIAQGTYKELSALNEKEIDELKEIDQQFDKLTRSVTNFGKRATLALVEAFTPPKNSSDALAFSMGYGAMAAQAMSGRMSGGSAKKPAGTPAWQGPMLPPDEVERRQREADKEDDERRKAKAKADEEIARRQEKVNELLDRAAEGARRVGDKLVTDWIDRNETQRQLAGRSLIAQNPTVGGVTLMGTRNFGQDTMVGFKKYDFGIDAQGFVTWGDAAEDAADKAKDSAKETVTWTDRLSELANQLQVISQTTGGLTGKLVGFAASLASGLGGVIAGFKQMKDAGKGLMGFLGKAGGALGIAASVISVGGSLWSGFKSIFGGGKEKREAAEASQILGTTVSREQLKALKEEAKQQGKDWRQYLKERKAADDKARAVEAYQNKMEGLKTAKGFAESILERLTGEDAGSITDATKTALLEFVNKINAAVMTNGLGIIDPRLAKSKKFKGAEGLAGDVAGAIGGMRQAGMVDTGLLAAGGAAAAEIQKQAVAAALAAGMTPEEAAKAGSAAIAPLLREQLNASLQSGKELDANTKALLEEAKKNGIEILADPAIETLDVAKEQLGELKGISEALGARRVSAASGFYAKRLPNLGGGLGPLIQTHAGERALILPESLNRPGGIIAAARGVYDRGREDREDRRDREPGAGAPGGGAPGATGGGGGTGPAALPEVKAMLEHALANAGPTVNFQNTQNVTANPMDSAESKDEFLRTIMDHAADQLAANAGRFSAEIDRRIRERAA